jgi:hypothetical protein
MGNSDSAQRILVPSIPTPRGHVNLLDKFEKTLESGIKVGLNVGSLFTEAEVLETTIAAIPETGGASILAAAADVLAITKTVSSLKKNASDLQNIWGDGGQPINEPAASAQPPAPTFTPVDVTEQKSPYLDPIYHESNQMPSLAQHPIQAIMSGPYSQDLVRVNFPQQDFIEHYRPQMPIGHLPFHHGGDYVNAIASDITPQMRRAPDGTPISMVPFSIGSDVRNQDMFSYHQMGHSYFPNPAAMSIDYGSAHDEIQHVF